MTSTLKSSSLKALRAAQSTLSTTSTTTTISSPSSLPPGSPLPKSAKHTVEPTGIWALVQRALTVSPNRSSGIPLNATYRSPPPGSATPALAYTPAPTLPASDIAENPYYGRDTRRAYPRLSVVTQKDVVALLEGGSREAPRELGTGEEGKREGEGEGEGGLVEVRREVEERGLTAVIGDAEGFETAAFEGGCHF